jgi:hypothetical protein
VAVNESAADHRTFLHLGVGHEVPFTVHVERRNVDTTRHEDGLAHLCDDLKWSLNSIENLSQNSWTKFNG